MKYFDESDHTGYLVARRSRNGFIFFLDSAPIFVCFDKQGSYETSSFGSEFAVMKFFCESFRGLQHKLRMFWITVEHSAYALGDNQYVLSNSSKRHSILKKKISSIACHFFREVAAKNEWRTACLNTYLNPSCMFSKILYPVVRREPFSWAIFFTTLCNFSFLFVME